MRNFKMGADGMGRGSRILASGGAPMGPSGRIHQRRSLLSPITISILTIKNSKSYSTRLQLTVSFFLYNYWLSKILFNIDIA